MLKYLELKQASLVLSAISLAANGNVTGSGAAAKHGNCGSATLGVGASVVLNNLLDDLLKANSNDMTSEEKDVRVNLITSIIAGIIQADGGDAAMANAGSRIEMENNYLKADEALEKFGLLIKLKNPIRCGYDQIEKNY